MWINMSLVSINIVNAYRSYSQSTIDMDQQGRLYIGSVGELMYNSYGVIEKLSDCRSLYCEGGRSMLFSQTIGSLRGKNSAHLVPANIIFLYLIINPSKANIRFEIVKPNITAPGASMTIAKKYDFVIPILEDYALPPT